MDEQTYRLAAAVNGFLLLPASGRMKVILPKGSLLRVMPNPDDHSGSLQVCFAHKSCRMDVAVLNALEAARTLADEGRN